MKREMTDEDKVQIAVGSKGICDICSNPASIDEIRDGQICKCCETYLKGTK